MIMALFAWSYV